MVMTGLLIMALRVVSHTNYVQERERERERDREREREKAIKCSAKTWHAHRLTLLLPPHVNPYRALLRTL